MIDELCNTIFEFSNKVFYVIINFRSKVMADDVIYLTGWDSEAQLIKNKKSNWPVAVKKYYPEDFEEIIKKNNLLISNTTNLVEGTILVKNPFEENAYLNFAEAESQMIHSKAQYISEILQNLGATSFTTSSYICTEEKKEKKVTGDVTTSKASGNIAANKTTYEKKELQYKHTDSFTGEYTKENYEKAKLLATKYGLDKDFDVAKIIEQRNPDNTNQITARTISLDMSREFNKTKEIALGLTSEKITLNSSYTSVFEKKSHTVYEIDIKF